MGSPAAWLLTNARQRYVRGLLTTLTLAVAAGTATPLLTRATAHPPQSQPAFDLVIRGGTVIDGTGAAGVRADVGITGDRISLIARDGIDPARGRLTLDADGLVVAPGFIDQHAHIQNIAEFPLAETHVRQGITSIVSSPHSGEQVYPLGQYISKLKVVPNIGYFAGHSTVRRRVIGVSPRQATPPELAEMKRLVAEFMRDGALGLSSGLATGPGSHAPASEIVELARVAASHGGIYVSHVRDDAGGVLEAVAELIRTAEAAGIPGQISHHTVSGASQWGMTSKTLALIDAARQRGLDVTLDIYPYTGNVVASTALLPPWLLEGAPTEASASRRWLADRLSDTAIRAKAEGEIVQLLETKYVGRELSRARFLDIAGAPEYVGWTLEQLARERQLPVSTTSGARLILDMELRGGFTLVMESIHDDDLRRLIRHPATLFDTEAPPAAFGVGRPLPRAYGSFPRVLAKYVREERLLTLEAAVQKMTSLSADQIGQDDRGRIRQGAYADVVVFDPRTVSDRSTFEDPHQFSVGIRHVVVNGVPVIRGGALTGEKPGRALKGPARRGARRPLAPDFRSR